MSDIQPGRETDRRVAEKLGKRIYIGTAGEYINVLAYSTDTAAAIGALEELGASAKRNFTIHKMDDKYCVMLSPLYENIYGEADTLPLAVFRAILAMGDSR